MGQGSRTGRGLGLCSGYDFPGYAKGYGGEIGRGFGFNRGRGRGIGYGRGRFIGGDLTEFYHGLPRTQSISKNDEIKMLKNQAESLKRSQTVIEKRLSELEKADD
jgi:hypothetical protein